MPSHQARATKLERDRLLRQISRYYFKIETPIPVQNIHKQDIQALRIMVSAIDKTRPMPN